jgi:hypothetical protein
MILEYLPFGISREGFERFARRRRLSRPNVLLVALSASAVTVVFFVMSCLGTGVMAEHYLLKRFGLEATAVADRLSRHVVVGKNNRTEYEKINYTFSAADGQILHSVIDRPTTELAGIKPSEFTVLYWKQIPSVNIPRRYQPQNLVISLLICTLVISGLYFALIAWRAFVFCETM